MLNFLHIYSVFNIVGILQLKFSKKDDTFTINKLLIPYSILIAVLFQLFILFEGHANMAIVAVNAFGCPDLGPFVKFVLAIDFISYVVLNLTTSLAILLRRRSHCKLLNKLMKTDKIICIQLRNVSHDERNFIFRVKSVYGIILIIFAVMFPWHSYNYFGVTMIGFARYISINCHSVQYIFGHFYEMIVMEKVLAYFKTLERNVEADPKNIREYFDLYETFWKIAVKATNLFGFRKITCLTSVNLIVSFYWFCNYDRMENFLYLMVRQIVLGYIFIICNNWHRLDRQVSAIVTF